VLTNRITERKREVITAWLFLLPSLVGTLIFLIIPALSSLGLSFVSWDLISDIKPAGLANYERLINDPVFMRTLTNTFYYAIASVPIAIVLSLGLALLVHQKIKGLVIFRTMYFLPVISSSVAVAIVWRWVLNKDYGFVNTGLELVHLPAPDWLGSMVWSMPSVIIVGVWKEIGYFMVLFLAGLQGLPKDVYEAAAIDGANKWQSLRYITLPLLSPTIFFVFIISIISAFQVFDIPYIMTEGGPGDSTTTIVLYLYRQGFQFFRMGYASAIAWVLFIIILLFTLFQWFVTQRKVFYN
jgi:multiple sugar transport system permease protein